MAYEHYHCGGHSYYGYYGHHGYCTCPATEKPKEKPKEPEKPKEVTLKVNCTCNKCQCSVMKALNSLKGVDSVEIDVNKEMVKIRGSATEEACIKKIKKLGKAVQKWPKDEKKEEKKDEKKPEEKKPEVKKPDIVVVYQTSYPFNPCPYSYCSGPCYCPPRGGEQCTLM